MKKEIKDIEQKVAEAILSKNIDLQIGEDKYSIARPTIRTLISVSYEISKLPQIEVVEGKEIHSIINYAKNSKQIGRIFATMILGVKKRNRFVGFFKKNEIEKLADKIIDKYTPSELNLALVSIFSKMEIRDFFVLTTSLKEASVIKPTKEVD
jgi:hypothetical protein